MADKIRHGGCKASSSTDLFDFGSVQLIENPNLLVQHRKPRSKNRRIRRKWAKRRKNWRPDLNAYRMGNRIIAHPILAAKIRQQLREPNAKSSDRQL